VVLVLPDVAQLVRHEVVGDGGERAREQDQVAHVVTREAPEPRQPEEPRHVQDADALQSERLWVERHPLEARAGARERRALRSALPAPAEHHDRPATRPTGTHERTLSARPRGRSSLGSAAARPARCPGPAARTAAGGAAEHKTA